MDTGPLVQPERHLEELAGDLQVPDRPVLSAGYADIYHGVWTRPDGMQVEVAIKELKIPIPKDRQTDPETLRGRPDIRMKREVLAWSQTTHRNLHPLLGYRSKPRPRIISPWCRHGNLKDYLLKTPGLSRLDRLRLVYQAGCALNHLHSQTPPICHADIKPENVLMNDSYEASLSDFGLSRLLDDFGESSGLTTSETVKGTLNYMAGELFIGEKARPSLETDVYAFGGLILTVMSGNPPYFKLRGLNIMLQATQFQPPRPEDHPDLPPSDPLWTLIRRCWSKNPSARPTMREVLGELDEYTNTVRSSSESIPCAPSVVQYGVGEGFSTNLHTPNATPQGQPLALLSLNPVPVDGSSMTAIEATGMTSAGAASYAHEIFKSLEVESKGIPVIGRYVAAVADVGLSLVGMIQTMYENGDIVNVLGLKARMLATLLERVKRQSSFRRPEEIASSITEIMRELQSAQGSITEWCSSELLKNALFPSDDSEGLRTCRRTVRKVLEEIELLVSLNGASLVAEFEGPELKKDRRRLLDRLGDGNFGGQGNTIEDITCLPGTRIETLDRIDSWIRSPLTSDRVLWIVGMAGRGKSTIASTVAHSWRYRASCAIFHFRRGRNELDARMVCALARQLGSSLVPEVKTALLECVRENEDVANQRLDEQFEILLVASLGKLKDQPRPILIVVDALDECQTTKDVIDFIKLIDRHSSSLPPNVKFLLTCRPESSLLRVLEPTKWHAEDLDSAPDVSSDLALFIIQACMQIRDAHNLPSNWPSPGDVGRLVEMSQGLFQWAQTAITHVGDGSPVARLRGLLQNPAICGLDNLYDQILSKAFKDAEYDPMRHQLLSWVLGTLALAPCPVSLEVIAVLSYDSGTFGEMGHEEALHFLHTEVLGCLKSILFVPVQSTKPIRLMHTSIRDLLLDPKRCKQKPYFVEPTQENQRLAGLCLRFMDRDLRHNICNLSNLSNANSEVQDMIERHLPRGLQYCCRSWSIHLTAGIRWSEPMVETVDDILTRLKLVSETKLLYWLEVMSLIGAITDAFNVAEQIYQWLLQWQCGLADNSLTSLWSDAQRFIAAFREPISFGALHIYASALPHCPTGTKLWEMYGGQAASWILHPKRQSNWPRNIWSTTAGARVNVVEFSPDGKVLASGSDDSTIRLWDTRTGTPLGDPLAGHRDCVTSVSFSSDGKVLASASDDETLRLWNAGTGVPLGDPLTGHSDCVSSVSFSPNGKVLASASEDKTVRLWDARTGAPLGDPLTGHTWPVRSVSFSPDGKLLASASDDRTIRLWDTGTGALLGDPLTGHRSRVTSVSFSPDGKVLSSASDDGTVRLWDAGTGTPLGDPLTGHSDWITSVSFSPDGKVLASATYDGTVCLWDAGTRTSLSDSLTGHNGWVSSVSFSPDGKVLASASYDGTVRLWDARTGTLLLGDPLTGHNYTVMSVSFSLDGKVQASASDDETAHLWDAGTGTPLGDSLIGQNNRVTSVSFSPDGKVLASGSDDGTARLWDAGSGVPLGGPLTGHSDCVSSVLFSPNGKVMASASEDKTVRLWDAGTRAPLGDPLIGHRSRVTSVSFSLDSKILASASDDGTVRLWDAGTGAPLGDPLTHHSWRVTSVSFSPDGKVLASGSEDTMVRLWDAGTGAPLGDPLTGHSWPVRSVAFSPDGKVLASGSDDRTVRLWDAGTGVPIGDPLTGHNGRVTSVSFSPDSKVLASATYNGTVRQWDTGTGVPLVNPLTGEHDWVEWYLSEKWPQALSQDVMATSSLDPLTPLTSCNLPEFIIPRFLCVSSNWLMCGSKRLLWIPIKNGAFDYPCFDIIFSHGRLALLEGQGRMLLILDLPRNLVL